jgi:hypothetical protein
MSASGMLSVKAWHNVLPLFISTQPKCDLFDAACWVRNGPAGELDVVLASLTGLAPLAASHNVSVKHSVAAFLMIV